MVERLPSVAWRVPWNNSGGPKAMPALQAPLNSERYNSILICERRNVRYAIGYIILSASSEVCPMARDLVCGMQVDEQDATAKGLTSEYEGQTYYFCAAGCKREFDKHPEQFVQKA